MRVTRAVSQLTEFVLAPAPDTVVLQARADVLTSDGDFDGRCCGIGHDCIGRVRVMNVSRVRAGGIGHTEFGASAARE
jgi:hypothetical protein